MCAALVALDVLQNDYFLREIGFDTAENGPSKLPTREHKSLPGDARIFISVKVNTTGTFISVKVKDITGVVQVSRTFAAQ